MSTAEASNSAGGHKLYKFVYFQKAHVRDILRNLASCEMIILVDTFKD